MLANARLSNISFNICIALRVCSKRIVRRRAGIDASAGWRSEGCKRHRLDRLRWRLARQSQHGMLVRGAAESSRRRRRRRRRRQRRSPCRNQGTRRSITHGHKQHRTKSRRASCGMMERPVPEHDTDSILSRLHSSSSVAGGEQNRLRELCPRELPLAGPTRLPLINVTAQPGASTWRRARDTLASAGNANSTRNCRSCPDPSQAALPQSDSVMGPCQMI